MANYILIALAFCIVMGFCHCGWTLAIIVLWLFFAYQITCFISLIGKDFSNNRLALCFTAAAGVALLFIYFPHLLHPGA